MPSHRRTPPEQKARCIRFVTASGQLAAIGALTDAADILIEVGQTILPGGWRQFLNREGLSG